MNNTMSGDCAETTKMNCDQIKEDYGSCNRKVEQKCFIAWSPLEENKVLFKQKYVSCSRSVPRRSKRFVQYRISRSLNFDVNIHNSSSENSSFEEGKHLSRSAKIMRALNFGSSSSYYGKTKIKKSLNFNLTPSPKRFIPTRKSIRKTLSLNFSSPLSVSNKFLNFDDSPNNLANCRLLYSSSESIDENQNETPLQQNTKECGILHYSTPNTKLNRKSLYSNTPSLRDQLKESINNIVCQTPNSQSLKHVKNRLVDVTSTSRNLLHEFYDNSDNRPSTPENVVHVIPESMSAIKRSHKKERCLRRNERDSSLIRYPKDTNLLEECQPMDQFSDRNMNSNNSSMCNSGGNISDTGSLFDYTQEEESSINESGETSNCGEDKSEVHQIGTETKSEENTKNSLEILFDQDLDIKTDTRTVTPDPMAEVLLESQITVTPENRIKLLEKVCKDSIKKSHKKNKDDNKKKLFSPKILGGKLEIVERNDINSWESFEQDINIAEDEERLLELKHSDVPKDERACTPERVNSSRLLLSQFSSVKKSHKKDKHNKILSGFLKRQEYFNKETDFCKSNANNSSELKNSIDVSSGSHTIENFKDSVPSVIHADDIPLITLSPSKRRKSLNISVDYETSGPLHSDLREADTAQEEFQIFTPLKRKRSLIAPTVKECLHFYDLPSGKNEVSENVPVNISLSRCLTPIPNFHDNYEQSVESDVMPIKLHDDIINEISVEANNCDSVDVNGRSTPRDMPTTELYFNVDSIKRSHKKNKRGNSSRKTFNLFNNNDYAEEGDETSINGIKDEALEHSSDSVIVYDVKESTDNASVETSSDCVSNDEYANVSIGNVSLNMTPPNCLKTKNYIRLLRETSIKRSHKKVRDQRKQEIIVNANELSDDGSIFDDEEKLTCNEDQPN